MRLPFKLVGELAGIFPLDQEKAPGYRARGSTINAGCGGVQLP
jgi:hypothetical protein